MKTNQNRGYIHREFRAVMLWHKHLECWVFTRVRKSGRLESSIYGFRNSRSQAITAIRKEYGKSIPQKGWEKITVKHKGIEEWNDLVHFVWSTNTEKE